MRARILNSLFDRMQVDERLFFLTADMGINLVERFLERFPARSLNVGIAEQNLIGVSAGLCKLGYRPFVYTISNFLVHRCFEQIRNDIVLHDCPVTLLGTSAGFDNAPLGPTHHVIDELGALRTLPRIDLYCPSSVSYADTLIDRILSSGRPAYVRMPKAEAEQPELAADAVYLPARAPEVLLVSYGTPAQACLDVQRGHDDVSVLICNRLRPLDDAVVVGALRDHVRAFVVEDHFGPTGLYGDLCRICMEQGIATKVTALGPTDYTLTVGASAAFYARLYEIDGPGIEQAIAARETAEVSARAAKSSRR